VHCKYILIYIQQDARLHSLFISGYCSTCFGWYFHPSSWANTTVSTASGICHTVTAICRYRGRVGTGLSVLWVAYASVRSPKLLRTKQAGYSVSRDDVGWIDSLCYRHCALFSLAIFQNDMHLRLPAPSPPLPKTICLYMRVKIHKHPDKSVFFRNVRIWLARVSAAPFKRLLRAERLGSAQCLAVLNWSVPKANLGTLNGMFYKTQRFTSLSVRHP
jgi:hypothetical protein